MPWNRCERPLKTYPCAFSGLLHAAMKHCREGESGTRCPGRPFERREKKKLSICGWFTTEHERLIEICSRKVAGFEAVDHSGFKFGSSSSDFKASFGKVRLHYGNANEALDSCFYWLIPGVIVEKR